MAKALQVKIDEEAVEIMNLLKNQNTKSLFINEAIKNYSKTNDAKIFLHQNSNGNTGSSEKEVPSSDLKDEPDKPKLKEW